MSDKEIRELIKRKLHAYNSIARECGQLEEQIRALDVAMTAPRVQALDGMPHGHGGGDVMANIVSEMVSLQDRYREKLHRLNTAMTEVENMIEGLDPTERRLMRYRYIDGMVWEEVCVAMSYSWRQTHNIHGRALDKLVEAEMVSK